MTSSQPRGERSQKSFQKLFAQALLRRPTEVACHTMAPKPSASRIGLEASGTEVSEGGVYKLTLRAWGGGGRVLCRKRSFCIMYPVGGRCMLRFVPVRFFRTFPSCMTRILSESMMVLSRWAMVSTVHPENSSRMASCSPQPQA